MARKAATRWGAKGQAERAALGMLYGDLHVLLQSEDMALVLGALLLFGILAAIMIVTRRVDWYRITARDTLPMLNAKAQARRPMMNAKAQARRARAGCSSGGAMTPTSA